MTLGNDNGTDGQTDRQTDRVRRNMRPPPREEGRIKTVVHNAPPVVSSAILVNGLQATIGSVTGLRNNDQIIIMLAVRRMTTIVGHVRCQTAAAAAAADTVNRKKSRTKKYVSATSSYLARPICTPPPL